MEKDYEIHEIDSQLNKNAESTDHLQRRLAEIQQEEEIYRKDILSCASNIEALSQVLQGNILVKIQEEAYSSMDEMKSKVENMFLSEREQIEDGLRSLAVEREALTDRKQELIEEER